MDFELANGVKNPHNMMNWWQQFLIYLNLPVPFLGITMQLYGKGKVKWFDSSATGDGADPVYRGQETYINETIHLYESSKFNSQY